MFENLTDKMTGLFKKISGKSVITEKNIEEAAEEIKLSLLDADVNIRVVRRFVNQMIEEAKGQAVLKSVHPGQQFVKLVHDKLVTFLGEKQSPLKLKGRDTLSVILLLGLQGSGKTTTASKLALSLARQGRKPLLAACDLVRPGAVEQLKILGESVNVPVHAPEEGEKTSPIKLAQTALKRARKELFDTLIVDTAGRLQADEPLIKELRQIKKDLKADETILVADAMTGQNAVDIARTFHEKLELSGVILSKFDSDTRGGAALSLKSITGTGIKFIGTGERPDDLEVFHPDRMASRILGMGDVVSLVEKAQEITNEEEAERLQKKISSRLFTLEDYLEQFRKIRKMGSLQSYADMIPGFRGRKEDLQVNEKEIKREEAIILSMTLKERRNHRIIGPPRKKRIAKGSGTSVSELNRLLKKFEKMKLSMRKLMNNKKYQSRFMEQMGVQQENLKW